MYLTHVYVSTDTHVYIWTFKALHPVKKNAFKHLLFPYLSTLFHRFMK